MEFINNFNQEIFLLLIGFIASLVAGFGLHEKKKETFAKHYIEYKYLILMLLIQIHIFSVFLFLKIGILEDIFLFFAVLEFLFLFYIIYLFKFKDRCSIQHFTVIHNFLLIPLLYLSYEIPGYYQLQSSNFFLLIVILIYVYNILMFQFAKYNVKKPFLWD